MKNRLLIVVLGVFALQLSVAISYDDATIEAYFECVDLVRNGLEFEDVPPSCLIAAEAGIPGAEYLMGEILFSIDENNNLESAAQWFLKAAANGHPTAKFTIGVFQLQGMGVAQDQEAGVANLRAAICSGHPTALAFAKEAELDFDCSAANTKSVSEGVWEGRLETISAPEMKPPVDPDFHFRLDLAEDGPKVFRSAGDGAWHEIKPGGFHAAVEGPSAVVASIDDGWDFDGRWVETWAFTITATTDTSATVVWVRQVNNVHVLEGFPHATFTIVGKGEFTKVDSVPE